MKIQWHYNNHDREWFASEDHGSNMWIISKHYDLSGPKLKSDGYKVTFNHLQETMDGLSYGCPVPIFYCRYLKEAKAFVQMCVNSKTIESSAYEYIHFPGKYGAQNNLEF